MEFDLEACLSGDPAAWEAFVERWSRVIFAAVSRTCRAPAGSTPRTEVEDAAQEVFVRLVKDDFRLLRTYDAERASLSTWLTVVARSVAVDAVRRQGRALATLDGGDLPEPAAPVDHDDTAAGPDLPLHLLTERQRLVLRMLYHEEMSVAEAARMIGVDEQTIRSTKHKALSRLREQLRT